MAYDPNNWDKYAAVVWQPDPSGPQPILLGDLLGPIHYELSIPDNGWGPQRAINGEGRIVGYASKAGRSIGAVIWHEQAPGVFVPSYLAGSGAARAINSLGQIIGGGYFWDAPNAAPVRLNVEGFVGPDAYDLNDGGQIVGTAFDISVGRYRPLLWNPDDEGGFEAMVLPSLPPDGLTFAEAINNQGTVVGRCSGAGFSHAVVWEKKSDHYEVKTLAPPDGYVKAWIDAFGRGDGTFAEGDGLALYGDAALRVPLSVPAIADALTTLLTDANTHATAVARGRARLEAFTWSRTASVLRETLERAATRGAKR